jgi:hypothetical protein
MREKVRGENRVSSLMKQKKRGEIYFVIYIAGFFFKKKFCSEEIVKQKIYQRPTNHYWCGHLGPRGGGGGTKSLCHRISMRNFSRSWRTRMYLFWKMKAFFLSEAVQAREYPKTSKHLMPMQLVRT